MSTASAPPAPSNPPAPAPTRARLLELARVFLRLGATAFGGPAAHIALMEDEAVRRRGWLTRAEFVDLLGATNLIPGPNSTELAIHLGYRRAGWRGLIVAGACFILPAMLLVGILADLYVRYGALPRADALLYGVKPVVIAVVAQALVGLTRTAAKTWALGALGALALTLSLLGVHELVVLFAAGAAAAAAQAIRRRAALAPGVAWPAGLGLVATAAGAPSAGLGGIFLFFLKVGSVLFGSGYVLLAFLRADLVERWHWLSERQLLDAIAIGQVTPGPVFTTATFVGYLLHGVPGGLIATLGIFLPAFVFVAVSARWVVRLRASAAVGGFLDGVNVASLALMAAVAGQLLRAAVRDVPSAAIAGVSAVLLLRFRVSSVWLILGGGLVGLALGRGGVG